MTREQQLERDLSLLYWRIASLPASRVTQPLWESVKRIVSERGIDTTAGTVDLDGLAGEMYAFFSRKN